MRWLALVTLAACASAGLPSPPGPGNILVVRSSGATASIDEFSPAGAFIQTVAIDACVLGTGNGQAYGSNSADGGFALFACGTAATLARVVVRVDDDDRESHVDAL